MTSRNWLRQRIAEGETVRAIWLQLGSPALAEAAVWAGWDCVVIDNEHGDADLETTVQMVRAVQAAGGHCIVRVPWNDQIYFKRILDRGIDTIIVPMINDRKAAEDAVAACRYPPLGIRGYAAPIVRASHYGAKKDYLATAPDELFLIGMIEHKEAIPHIPEIAAVDGLDMLFLGPNDLSGTIGMLERLNEDESEALSASVEAAILSTGKPMGTVCRPRWSYGELKARGHSLVAGPSDVSLFTEAARGAVMDMDAQFAEFPAAD